MLPSRFIIPKRQPVISQSLQDSFWICPDLFLCKGQVFEVGGQPLNRPHSQGKVINLQDLAWDVINAGRAGKVKLFRVVAIDEVRVCAITIINATAASSSSTFSSVSGGITSALVARNAIEFPLYFLSK